MLTSILQEANKMKSSMTYKAVVSRSLNEVVYISAMVRKCSSDKCLTLKQ